MASRTVAPKSKPGKAAVNRVKERVQVTLDPKTIKILARIVRNVPEVETRSEAIRYLAHLHAKGVVT
jgi:hypothetical protein